MLQDSASPVWNEDFKFQLKPKDAKKDKMDLQSQLAGHFLSLTIYALLDTPKPDDKRKSSKTLDAKTTLNAMNEEPKSKSLLSSFSSFKASKDSVQKGILEKRRTVGAATWNFDSKLFQNDLKNGLIGTPDIWRPINAIASGLNAANTRVSNIFGYYGIHSFMSFTSHASIITQGANLYLNTFEI